MNSPHPPVSKQLSVYDVGGLNGKVIIVVNSLQDLEKYIRGKGSPAARTQERLTTVEWFNYIYPLVTYPPIVM